MSRDSSIQTCFIIRQETRGTLSAAVLEGEAQPLTAQGTPALTHEAPSPQTPFWVPLFPPPPSSQPPHQYFLLPMQLLSHLQSWAKPAMHLVQALQCLAFVLVEGKI